MRIKPEIGSVVGPSDTTHWGQAILSPSAYGVVELEATDARASGIELLTTLSDQLKEPPVSLKELEQFARDLSTHEVKTIILLVPVGPIVYIVVAGSGAVYLKRENNVACLLPHAGSLSGEVKTGDTILLASKSMVSAVSQDSFVGVFDHLTAREAAEKLTLLLHEAESDMGSAALIFQVSEFIHTEDEQKQTPAPVSKIQRPMETVWRSSTRTMSGLTRGLVEVFSGVASAGRRVARFPPLSRFLKRRSESELPRRRRLSTVTLLLLILFGVSVVLGIIKKTRDDTSREVQNALTEATHAFEEGAALLELNPVKGRQRLVQAKEILEPFTQSLRGRSHEAKLVGDLYRQVLDTLTMAMHSVPGEPQLFFDGSLLKSGGSVHSLSLFEDVLGLLDVTNHSVYTLDVGTKKSAVVGGGEAVTKGKHIATYGDKAYILTEGGIAQVRMSDKKTIADSIPKSGEWGTIASLVAYGGNLYLLDTEKSRIWKYVATGESLPAGRQGFSELREYLNPDSLPDLTKATGMAIDGSVWVGTSDGKILRFSQGKEQTFTIQGVEPVLGQFLVVYTSDIVKNVYVLDRDNNRVVVLDKDGLYLAQYLWEGAITPAVLAVSESQKKILLLIEGKIYALELK